MDKNRKTTVQLDNTTEQYNKVSLLGTYSNHWSNKSQNDVQINNQEGKKWIHIRKLQSSQTIQYIVLLLGTYSYPKNKRIYNDVQITYQE